MAEKKQDGEPRANMVLRTVYLPVEVDEKLKTTALLRQRSKNDVIRNFIVQGLRTEAESSPPRQRRTAVAVESPKRRALGEVGAGATATAAGSGPGGSRRSG